jgi:hypothetical protein
MRIKTNILGKGINHMELGYKKNIQFKDKNLKYKRRDNEEAIELIIFIVLLGVIFILNAFLKFL